MPLNQELAKSPTGIQGLDEITNGGLPRGRPTLICGGAGSGKTLLAASFLLNGVVLLFVRLEHAISSIGARRIVLDTVESLFAGLSNPGILRAELRRLFRWLKDKRLTAVITGERGESGLTRQGLEESLGLTHPALQERVSTGVQRLDAMLSGRGYYRGSTVPST